MVAHLFPICHGRATPSLISSAYSFACGSIFLAFLILQNFVPLVLGFFAFVFSRGCGVFWFYGFIVCLFPKKISGFMGLLEIWLVTVFVSQNFSANPFLWLFCRFFTSIWLGIWVFFYGEGRDMRGEIIRTWSFFFFFFFLNGVIGVVFAGFGGVWLDVFIGNLCLVISIRKCKKSFLLVNFFIFYFIFYFF